MSKTQSRIVALRQKGHTYHEISDMLGISEVYVYRTLRKAGLTKPAKRDEPDPAPARRPLRRRTS